VHDLGFLFWSTWRRWYEATGDPAYDEVVVHAGRTLAMRFNERGRYLPSFLAPDSLFIDIMMNVGVIFHAARRTGDADLARIWAS
jgi:unsaturated chondroitin disaccharide hydrolase